MERGWKPNSLASSSKSWPVGSGTSTQTTFGAPAQRSLIFSGSSILSKVLESRFRTKVLIIINNYPLNTNHGEHGEEQNLSIPRVPHVPRVLILLINLADDRQKNTTQNSQP